MTTARPEKHDLPQYARHPRDWRENLYVYPVLSRRSGGLSIGINLNPDTACNFDCIYCQVDRTITPRVRDVDPVVLRRELEELVRAAIGGALFAEPEFAGVPQRLRRVCDIAFSGDGEPTTCPRFAECVRITAEVKTESGLADARIVLITDACYLTRPGVVAGLEVMDRNDGEIWAKLDAGTEAYYRLINRPNYPLRHVIDNIIAAARVRPVVIQSLFLRLDGAAPPPAEIEAFADRLNEITAAGGKIAYVQVYTVARRPAEANVTALTDDEVDRIVEVVRRRTGLRAEPFYGVSPSTSPE
jgi:wyosine [tRNA(Phe)-imidazoG37] synthetase (radical SAM superfamily)